MTPNDKLHFAELIGLLAEAWRQKITPVTIKAYEIACRDLSIEDIAAAVEHAIVNGGDFMPSPSNLRELAGGGSGEQRALEAWNTFVEGVMFVGGYKTVQFEDGALNATVRSLGGWAKLCDLEGDDFDKWLRKDFIKTYTAMESRGVCDQMPLSGRHVVLSGGQHAEVVKIESKELPTGLEHKEPPRPQLPPPEPKRLPGPPSEFARQIGRRP